MAKRGRPKKVNKLLDETEASRVCYICDKKITNGQRFYAIGKNKQGIELYRHWKCKPYGKLTYKRKRND